MIEMLKGAMDELVTRRPLVPGHRHRPVIDAEARADIAAYVDGQAEGRLLKRLDAPKEGTFVGAALVRRRHRRTWSARSSARCCMWPASRRRTSTRPSMPDQRPRLRPDLRPAHPHRRPRVSRSSTASMSATSTSTAIRSAPSSAASPSAARESCPAPGPKAGGPNYVGPASTDKPRHALITALCANTGCAPVPAR
jgi:hypothetical protein